MKHTVKGQPANDAHPEDLLREFGHRFDVLYELAFACVCAADHMPEPLEKTFAHGINELHGDFEEVYEAVKAWNVRWEAEREAEREAQVAP